MNTIVVFDFETTSADPHSCEPVQVAGLPLHSKTLEQVGEPFMSMMRPTDFDNIDPQTLKWHANLKNCSTDEILKTWKKAPDSKLVWQQFCDYVNKFNWKSNKWASPVPAGHNIINFDLIIAERMNEMHGMGKHKFLFHPRDVIDTLNLCFLWLESKAEVKSYSMDFLRKYFGMSDDGAHDALVDVQQCAQILRRFLTWHRALAAKTDFEGSFAE